MTLPAGRWLQAAHHESAAVAVSPGEAPKAVSTRMKKYGRNAGTPKAKSNPTRSREGQELADARPASPQEIHFATTHSPINRNSSPQAGTGLRTSRDRTVCAPGVRVVLPAVTLEGDFRPRLRPGR